MHAQALTPVLWLDPFRRLQVEDQERLGAAALAPCVIRTQDELLSALNTQDRPGIGALVLGLGSDIQLLDDTLSLLRQHDLTLPIICRVERRHLELAINALRQGACHVLAADDWSVHSWQAALERTQPGAETGNCALDPLASSPDARSASDQPASAPGSAVTAPATRAADDAALHSVVYVDPVSRNLLALAQRVAQANVTVLLEGPTGSGKEVLARVLHESSSAAGGPFVGLNCAAMPEHMIEDMLFGHEKGAFTGAIKEHRGLFEQAQGGTLFLDEIAELPMSLQAKLLRVLQERSMARLGAERTITLDVRVIAATNKDLRQAIAQREFREDLYFRLSTFKLKIPPLAQRKGDIFPLVLRLLARHQPHTWQVSEQAQAQLLAHGWPGNVRELENVVQRAMVLCPDQKIDSQHLLFDDMPETLLYGADLATSWAQQAPPASQPSHTGLPALVADSTQAAAVKRLQAAVKHSEQHVIRAALDSSQSKLEAAQKLGISARTLRYKLARLRDASPALGLSAG